MCRSFSIPDPRISGSVSCRSGTPLSGSCSMSPPAGDRPSPTRNRWARLCWGIWRRSGPPGWPQYPEFGRLCRGGSTETSIRRGARRRFFSTSSSGPPALWTASRDRLYGRLPAFKKRVRFLDIVIAILPFLILYPIKALGDTLVFGKIRAKLGGRFVAGISGGGALPKAVDRFFASAGILLLEGYGLTETAPVLGVRSQYHPVPGTIGPVFPGTLIEIRTEEGELLRRVKKVLSSPRVLRL